MGMVAHLLGRATLARAQTEPALDVAPLEATRAEASTSQPDAEPLEGRVSYYPRRFAGRKTASGERFNPKSLTMAHKTLPFGTLVRVVNVRTQQSVVVRVNDRGPHTPGRIADLSPAAAHQLGMLRAGVIVARLEPVTEVD